MLVFLSSQWWELCRLTVRARSVEPAEVLERGKGMGWIPQEPGRSGIDQLQIADGAVAWNGTGPEATISSARERTRREKLEWQNE